MTHGPLHNVASSPWFAASKTPLAVLDRQARFRGVNDAYLDAAGRPPDELLGSVVFDAFPDNPNDPGANGVRNLAASLERVMRLDRDHDMVVQRYDVPAPDDPSGFIYKVWSPANSPIHDDDGRVAGVLHRVEDITAVTEFLGRPQGTVPRELNPGQALRAYSRAIAYLKESNADLRAQNKSLVDALITVGSSRLPVTTKNGKRGWIRRRLQELTPRLGPACAVCAVAVDALGMDGAVLTVRVTAGSHFVIGANSTWARVVKELAYTTGEGPGDSAVSMGIPVLIADLAAESHRWPGFANAALEIGVNAAFAFPLRVGDDPTGALVLYRRQPGVLAASELADAVLIADVAQGTLIDVVHKVIREHDEVLASDDPGRERWAAIHAAAGMISIQLGITTDEAMSRLRAHAFAEGRPIVEVAQDVIDRRLRLD